MNVDYKTAIAAVKAGEKIEMTAAEFEAVNEVAKKRKAKRIPAESVQIKSEVTVTEKKKAGRPKGEPKPCAKKDEGCDKNARSNGMCAAHAAKEKYKNDESVRAARKAASARYAAKMRDLREKKKALEAAASAE